MEPPESRSHYHRAVVIGVLSLYLGLPTISVILRLWSRKLGRSKYWYDDYFMIFALVQSCAIHISFLIGLRYGLGEPVMSLPPEKVTNWLKLLYATELVYNPCVASIKFSILLFYRRLFPTRSFGIALCIVAACIIAWLIATEIVCILQCRPIHGFWDLKIKSECVVLRNYIIGNAVPNIATDFAILVLPIPIVWSLRLSKVRKAIISAIFLLGAFTSVTSLIRLTYVLRVPFPDIIENYDVASWTAIEIGTAIVTANLLVMGPLLKVIREKGSSLCAKVRPCRGPQLRPSGSSTTDVVAGYNENFEMLKDHRATIRGNQRAMETDYNSITGAEWSRESNETLKAAETRSNIILVK